MMNENDDKLGEEIIDEMLDKYIDTFSDTVDFAFLEMNLMNDCLSETSIPFQDAHPVYEPVQILEDSSSDIPADPKEWLVHDQNTNRLRPPRLFEFLILLLEKSHYNSYASYTHRCHGIFLVHQPEKVAYLWEQIKNRQANQKMTYDKFARAVRWYYKLGIMTKTNARYTLQFSEKTLRAYILGKDINTTVDGSPLN